jgi:translation initiation factor 1
MSGRLVYDSDAVQPGRCPTCGKRLDRCTCGQAQAPRRSASPAAASLPRDGVVRLQRDRKGRGGKTVTVITGLPGAQLDALARDLKRLCGTGGTVRGDTVEIHGDHRDRLLAALQARGFTVKLAGG